MVLAGKPSPRILFLVAALAILVAGVGVAYAVVGHGVKLTFSTEVKEPIVVEVVKGMPSSLSPGDEATAEFVIKNTDSRTYLLNLTVELPWEGDGLNDGSGFDVVSLVVGGENKTSDLLDDGVAHIVLQGGETLIADVKVKACGDAPSGPASISLSVTRTVVLNDPPKYIHLSWAVNDVYHTITIMWWTMYDVSGNTVVYDTSHHDNINEYAFKATATTHRVCAYGKCFPGYWHEVTLTGLEPGTTYYFRVGGPGGWSKEFKFRTIAYNQTIKLVFGGDSREPWGSGYELKVHPQAISNYPWSRIWISKAIAAENPDALVFTGDMVESGNKWEEWKAWFQDVTDNLVTSDGRIIPVIAVIGNHEMGSYPNVESTYEWFKGVFANPGNELWFSLDFPYTHLVVLASTGGCVGTWWGPAVSEAQAQVSFLEKDLSNTTARWKIVAFHIPWYDCYESGTGYPSEVYMKYWAPIIEKYGADFVVNGHVHNYMRTWPLRTIDIISVPVDTPWTSVGYKYVYELQHSSENGTTYIVSGSYGAPVDLILKGCACDVRDFMASAHSRHAYTMLTLNATNAVLETKDAAGHVLDEAVYPMIVENFTAPEYNCVS